MQEHEPEWYSLMKRESFRQHPFTMQKIRRIEQAVDALDHRGGRWRRSLLAVMAIAVCLVVFVLVGRTYDAGPESRKSRPAVAAQSPSMTPNPSPSAIASPSPSPSPSQQPARRTVQKIGEYFTGVDSHTVAIMTDGEPLEYQTYEHPELDFTKIKEGDRLWFEYEEEVGATASPRFLTRIKKIAKGVSILDPKADKGPPVALFTDIHRFDGG